MARTKPFDEHSLQYEDWFERNKFVYQSELQGIRRQLPQTGYGVEIGVGSGRFALPLGIKMGLEPASRMRELARERGIEVAGGIAEALPFRNDHFDFVLMVTVLCFLDNVEVAFKEAYRVTKLNGSLIIGFVDKQSPLGKIYLKHKNESVFYRIATFYSVDEVLWYLERAQFRDFCFTQTVFRKLNEISDIEPIKNGYGEGSFVVVRARK